MSYILEFIWLIIKFTVIALIVVYGGICLLSWLGGLFLNKSDEKQKEKEAAKEEFEQALADYNDPLYEGSETQYQAADTLATCYYYGSGVKKDRKLADKYQNIVDHFWD